MLFEQVDVYSSLSEIVTFVVADILPYAILIIGIILGFYILGRLISIVSDDKDYNETMANADREIARSEKLRGKF